MPPLSQTLLQGAANIDFSSKIKALQSALDSATKLRISAEQSASRNLAVSAAQAGAAARQSQALKFDAARQGLVVENERGPVASFFLGEQNTVRPGERLEAELAAAAEIRSLQLGRARDEAAADEAFGGVVGINAEPGIGSPGRDSLFLGDNLSGFLENNPQTAAVRGLLAQRVSAFDASQAQTIGREAATEGIEARTEAQLIENQRLVEQLNEASRTRGVLSSAVQRLGHTEEVADLFEETFNRDPSAGASLARILDPTNRLAGELARGEIRKTNIDAAVQETVEISSRSGIGIKPEDSTLLQLASADGNEKTFSDPDTFERAIKALEVVLQQNADKFETPISPEDRDAIARSFQSLSKAAQILQSQVAEANAPRSKINPFSRLGKLGDKRDAVRIQKLLDRYGALTGGN